MNRIVFYSVLVIAGTAIGSDPGIAVSGNAASIVAEARYPVAEKPGPIEVVQLTVDFSPGSWTSVHSHGGQAINLVLAGDITLREDGAERPHKAGQGWTDSTGRFHSAGNTGSGEARLLTTFLLPKGAPQTTVRIEPKLGPAIAHEARFDMNLPLGTEVTQQAIDLRPGGRVDQFGEGFTGVTVLDGEVVVEIGKSRKPYRIGESWSARSGESLAVENASTRNARIFVTRVIPKRSAQRATTTVVQALSSFGNSRAAAIRTLSRG
jgi:quercetin dioxygenase-like cupin family protein